MVKQRIYKKSHQVLIQLKFVYTSRKFSMGIICDYIILILILESKLAFGQNFYLMRYARQRLEVTYNTMVAVSPIHCNALCKRESSCRSVNYNTITGECQPSETYYADVAGNIVSDPDWDMYTLTGFVISIN